MQFDAPLTPAWAVSKSTQIVHKPVVMSHEESFWFYDRVQHEKFGTGRVIEHVIYKELVTVYFPNHGVKKLIAKLAPMSFIDIKHKSDCLTAHPYFYDEILFFDESNSFVLDLTMAKGGRQVNIWCLDCDYISKPQKKELWNHIFAAAQHVAVIKRDRKGRDLQLCAYLGCENYGDHRHHWAPRNTFGYIEADNWPTSFLCPEHHREWHNTMNGYRTNNKSKDFA